MKPAASEKTTLPVVLISGWGLPVAAVRALVPEGTAVTAWSLADFPAAVEGDPEAWVAQALAAAPVPALWIGWSLGGQLAMRAAARAPERVPAVMTLCSTPRFVAAPDWSLGRPEDEFDGFAESLADNPLATLRRFVLMQTRGDEEAQRARTLARDLTAPDRFLLGNTLNWLRHSDLRDLWQRQPACHILGERDPLVSVDCAASAAEGSRVRVIPGMAHYPIGRGAQRVRHEIAQYLNAPAHTLGGLAG